jgi:hypothetical protein
LEQRSYDTLTNNSEGAGILGTLSEAGIAYVKEVLVNQILKEITPLSLPDMHSQVKSPIGRVDAAITHFQLSGANVSHSDVELGKAGITVFAGDITAQIRLHWAYQYTSSYIPFPLGDGGWADIEVSFWFLSISLNQVMPWLPCSYLPSKAMRDQITVAFKYSCSCLLMH